MPLSLEALIYKGYSEPTKQYIPENSIHNFKDYFQR